MTGNELQLSREWYMSYMYQTSEGGVGSGFIAYKQNKYAPLTISVISEMLEDIKEENKFTDISLLSFGRFE